MKKIAQKNGRVLPRAQVGDGLKRDINLMEARITYIDSKIQSMKDERKGIMITLRAMKKTYAHICPPEVAVEVVGE